MAAVVAAEGLCKIKSSADKDTIRVEIDVGESGLEYDPGDALGIYASNAPEVRGSCLWHVFARGSMSASSRHAYVWQMLGSKCLGDGFSNASQATAKVHIWCSTGV